MPEQKPKILIVEDEPSLRTILKKLLAKKGYEIDTVSDGNLALKKLHETDYALAIMDIKMPGLSGLEILESLKKEKIPVYCIIMTAQDTMRNAVDAMKKGAYDYITKPFELDEMEMIVAKAIEARRLADEVKELRQGSVTTYDKEAKIVGASKTVKEIYKTIGKLAVNDVAVLITGESGTGKELVAKAIHQNSPRAHNPFIAVNCAAIPRELLESELFGYRKGAFTGAEENRAGFFEMANKGTLFLDEIGDLPLNLQAKLLRILQDKEVQRLGATETKTIDVRILAATNQNLEKLVKAKGFREDLFFRLNVIPFHLPPLRERIEDVPLLTEHFLNRLAKDLETARKSITPEAMGLLKQYNWPGNIRELENVIKRAAILSGNENLNVEDFSFFLGKKGEAVGKELEDMGLEQVIEARLNSFVQRTKDLEMSNLYETIIQMAERPLLRLILKQTKYNQIRAAKLLGINRNTLRKKIKELKITIKDEA
jgi:two-component system nitrogen regulation response regulator GlnG